jgi:hypothetical protein
MAERAHKEEKERFDAAEVVSFKNEIRAFRRKLPHLAESLFLVLLAPRAWRV